MSMPTDNLTGTPPSPTDDNQLIAERRDKLATIRKQAKATGGA